jgi:hypothetical protein
MRTRQNPSAPAIATGTGALALVLVGVTVLACAARRPAAVTTAHPSSPPSSGRTLDRQPVPRTLDEALETLERGLGAEAIAQLRIEEEDVAIRLVPTLGRWMQEHWGLATAGSLARWFEDRGLDRPDDMAAVILTSLWRKLHFRQIRLEEQIAWYRAVDRPR